MAHGLSEDDWQLLLGRIKSGNCTPFLGAGACAGTLPLGGDVAARWAREFDYPLGDARDLARVAQFLAVRMGDAMAPKERISEEFRRFSEPAVTGDGEPHSVLAELPLPIFITTNYDGFMANALRRARKDPQSEICRWNRSPAVKGEPVVLTSGFAPTPARPVVFHLHGRLEVPESLVLTEDDYLDFLVAVSREQRLLPHQIKKALAGASLLFIGYRLADWNFRVLHRGLVMAGESSLRRLSVTVQLHAASAEREYLEKYFGAMNVRVYWGDASDFASELRERWSRFDGHA
jgi:SIR2-like domain